MMMYPSKHKDELTKELNIVTRNITKCPHCSAIMVDLVTLSTYKRSAICLSCGRDIKRSDKSRYEIYYVMTKFGILSLRWYHLINPSLYIDDFILSPIPMQLARHKMRRSLTKCGPINNCLVWIPNAVNKGSTGMYVECNVDGVTDKMVIIHKNVSRPLSVINPCSFDIGKVRCDVMFVEPRIKQVSPNRYDEYSALSVLSSFKVIPTKQEPRGSLRKSITTSTLNQLLMPPFTSKFSAGSWSYLLMGSKLVFVFSNGIRCIPNAGFIDRMSFIKNPYRVRVCKDRNEITSLSMSGGISGSRVGITNQGTVYYQGGIKYYAVLMASFVRLILDTVHMMSDEDIGGMLVMESDFKWISGC